MPFRDELIAHLDELLDAPGSPDYGPNGLQVEGRTKIHRIVCGVSASLALLEAAAERKADAVVVHHGIVWNHASPRLVGSHRKRIKCLLEHDMNLIAYHLPLDRHMELGTASRVAHLLGWTDLEPFGDYKGRSTGVRGHVANESLATIATRIEEQLGRVPLVLPGGGIP